MAGHSSGALTIRLQDGLPFVSTALVYQGHRLTLDNVLVDTGSGGTIFSADKVLAIGLQYEANDAVYRIYGVGGSEFVFTKRIEQLSIGEIETTNFEIEIGAMEHTFDIDGIIGMDFLTQVGAVIDLGRLEIYQQETSHD
jgi:predicted aspartyl protease